MDRAGSGYGAIGQLLALGASLDDVEGYLERRSAADGDEERRSARWLEDWYAWQRPARPEARPEYLDPRAFC